MNAVESGDFAVARKLNGSRDNPLAHDRIDGLELLDKVIDFRSRR